MSTAAQRKYRALGPEVFQVEAFLPGYVLSGREQERLLDLYDLAHLAEQHDRVTFEDLRRVHTLAKPKARGSVRGKYSNVNVLLSRLMELSNALRLGVQVKDFEITFKSPSRTKALISSYLDSISTESDVDDQEGRAAA